MLNQHFTNGLWFSVRAGNNFCFDFVLQNEVESDYFESVCTNSFELPHSTSTSTASLERNDQDATSTLGGEQNIQQNVPFDLPLNVSVTDVNSVFHSQDTNASPLQPNSASTEDLSCMPMSETTDEDSFQQPFSLNQAVVNASELGKTISANFCKIIFRS